MTGACHRCGRQFTVERVGVRATCACGAWLHCCLACAFHEPGRANDCREPRAELVPDKEQTNFCDWFRPMAPATPQPSGTARAELEALFAKKPPA